MDFQGQQNGEEWFHGLFLKPSPRRKDGKNWACLALRKEDRGEIGEHFSNIWKTVIQRRGRICSLSSQSAGHIITGSSYKKPDFSWISGKTSCYSSTTMGPITWGGGKLSNTVGIQEKLSHLSNILWYEFLHGAEIGPNGLIGHFQLHYSVILCKHFQPEF